MAEQRMKVRDKKVQKMTKDGLVEENLTDKSSVRVSNRVGDVQMGRKQGEKEENLVDKSPRQSERSGKNIRPSVQKSRDILLQNCMNSLILLKAKRYTDT